MGNLTLPENVRIKLRELAAGIRRMRVLRGVCWFILAMLALLLATLVGDAVFRLSPLVRTSVFIGGIVAGTVAAWWFVIRRAFGPVPHQQLARAVEANYPSLAERLQTLVELDERADPANGSRAMMAMLARDTERRTARLNFLAAAPRGYSLRLAAVSLIAVLLVAAPFFLLPGSSERLRRVVQPWYVPPVEVSFRVVVSSGEAVVKRGESVTLAGYAERLKPTEQLPTQASVLLRDKGIEKAYSMRGDDKASFTFTKPIVLGDFEYAIVIGNSRSEWHKVTVVDPAQIAAGTRYRIRPPEYAKANVPESSIEGLGEIEALQFSTAVYELKFRQAVESVSLQWRPQGAAPNAPAEVVPVSLSSDRLSASAEFPIRSDGTLRWVLEGDQKTRTEIPLAVRAVRDTPPQFEKVAGLPAMAKEIRPGEPLVFELSLRDDIAVGSAVLEYGRAETLDGTTPFSEALPLPGLGTSRVEGQLSFQLTHRFREGEMVAFRLRIRDNRSIPAANLAPQENLFPPQGWATLKIRSDAAPLMEQEIRGQHETLRERITAIRAVVAEAVADLSTLRGEIQGKPKLAADQSVRLANNRERASESAKALEELAKAVEVVPDLRPLSESAKSIAREDLRPAEDSLRTASQETTVPSRDAAALIAVREFDSALAKLDQLLKLNERTAKLRQDHGRLARLSDEQDRLANNPAATVAKQQELKDKLQKAINDSDFLKNATTDANRQERKRMAGNLRELAENLRKLDDRSQELEDADAKKKLAGVSANQKELARRIAELAKRTEAASRLGNSPPLDKDHSENARNLIDELKTTEALTEQEKAARELDRLADTLEKGARERGDTKQAAAQLERWQRDLQRRREEAAKANPNGIPEELQKSLKSEQDELQKKIRELTLPKSEELEKLRHEALDNDGTPETMEKSAEALQKLSQATPGNDQRRRAASNELGKLRREQDALMREAEELQRDAVKQDADLLAKKRKDLATKQEDLARKVEQLDTPGEEHRRDKAAASGKQAGSDLQDSPKNSSDSQKETKRQLDRLRDAMDGKPTPDRTAGELARLQNELSEKLQRKPALEPEELQRLQRDQDEIQKQLGQLQAPEAEDALAKAREAVRQAEGELQKPRPDVDELKKKNDSASEALARLAEKLGVPRRNAQAQPEPGNVLPNAEDAKQARDLAGQQRELREQLSKAATGKPDAGSQAEREAIQKKHTDLSDSGKKLAESLDQGQGTKAAADAAKQAAESIEQAGQLQGKGKPAEAAANRRKALDSIKQATEALGEPGDGPPNGPASDDIARAAGMARDADRAMSEAIKNAKDGKPDSGGMAGAADKLKQATEQIAPKQNSSPKDAAQGNQAGNPDYTGPATKQAPSPLTAHLGKPWGDLPGEVKAQITQELKARYGEDYARIIKLYFEQLAERK